MVTKDEALRLSLTYVQANHLGGSGELELLDALREALAQPEQEPLEYWNAVEGWVKIDEVREHFDSVGCGTIYKTAGEDRTPIYTSPPKRQPLTDEKLNKIVDAHTTSDHGYDIWCNGRGVARAIEQAHGIKENL